MQYEIEINYDEDRLRAELNCPLCKSCWVFPFSAQRISGKLNPPPDTMLYLHLYGAGPDPKLCTGFDPLDQVPVVE